MSILQIEVIVVIISKITKNTNPKPQAGETCKQQAKAFPTRYSQSLPGPFTQES